VVVGGVEGLFGEGAGAFVVAVSAGVFDGAAEGFGGARVGGGLYCERRNEGLGA
jgi:hypothetical protein